MSLFKVKVNSDTYVNVNENMGEIYYQLRSLQSGQNNKTNEEKHSLEISFSKINENIINLPYKEIKELINGLEKLESCSIKIDWDFFTRMADVVNDEDFLERFKDKIDWKSINYFSMKEDLVLKYFDYVKVNVLLSCGNITESLLDKVLKKINWEEDANYYLDFSYSNIYKNLSEDFLDEMFFNYPILLEKSEFEFYSTKYSFYSEKFIKKYFIDYMQNINKRKRLRGNDLHASYYYLERYQRLSEDFIKKNWKSLNKKVLITNQKLSEELIFKKIKELLIDESIKYYEIYINQTTSLDFFQKVMNYIDSKKVSKSYNAEMGTTLKKQIFSDLHYILDKDCKELGIDLVELLIFLNKNEIDVFDRRFQNRYESYFLINFNLDDFIKLKSNKLAHVVSYIFNHNSRYNQEGFKEIKENYYKMEKLIE